MRATTTQRGGSTCCGAAPAEEEDLQIQRIARMLASLSSSPLVGTFIRLPLPLTTGLLSLPSLSFGGILVDETFKPPHPAPGPPRLRRTTPHHPGRSQTDHVRGLRKQVEAP